MSVDVRVNADDVRIAMRVLPKTLADNAVAAFGKIGKIHREEVAKNFGRNTGSGNRGRFWALQKMRQYRRAGDLPDVTLGVFSREGALLAHEKGMTVRARKGSLVIPILDARTKSGMVSRRYRVEVERRSAKSGKGFGGFSADLLPRNTKKIKLRGKLFLAQVQKQRATPGTYRRQAKAGPVLAQDRRRTKITKIFAILKKSVTIKGGTLGFFSTWDKIAPQRQRMMDRAVTDTLREIARLKGTSIAAVRRAG